MPKKFIDVSNIKDVETLAKKLELVLTDIYRLLSNVETLKTITTGVVPSAKPLQFWYDADADQVYFRRHNGTDKPIG